MRIDSMKKLVRQGDGPFLAYVKYDDKLPLINIAGGISECLCALANTSGGTVLLGVDEAGKAPGVKNAGNVLSELMNLIPALISPMPDMVGSIEKYGNGKLIKFAVMPSPGEPLPCQDASGRVLVRVGRKNLPVLMEYYTAFCKARPEIMLERTFPDGASWDDLDPDLLDRFRNAIKDTRTPEELMTKVYHLAEYNGDIIRPTLAALLLFGKEVGRWHTRPGVELVQVEGNYNDKSYQYRERRLRLELPLMVLPGIVFTHLGAEYLEEERRYDLFFKQKVRFPQKVWKEALINAIVHRDYSIEGAGTEVWLWNDRMVTKSPGLPPAPVTLEDMSRDGIHLSRNPLMARVFTDLGLMRESGEGIAQMIKEMEEKNLHPPEICCTGFFLNVILRRDPVYDKEMQKWLKKFEGLPLGPDHIRILVFAHAHDDTFSTMDYREHNKVDRDTAYRDVRDMVKLGIVEKAPKSRSRYRVK
ncbi:MAG: putative DNA binding domain-containing protein [Chloroflexi bacterium]|nr:putative DNA binding domain-containing protein [Chloroflexota bacterium]